MESRLANGMPEPGSEREKNFEKGVYNLAFCF